jgi:hypothetical protein
MITFDTSSSAPANAKAMGTIQAISRMNFYLWMYLAQEGEFEEAFEFVREKQRNPSPFETMLGISPWDTVVNRDSPFDDF